MERQNPEVPNSARLGDITLLFFQIVAKEQMVLMLVVLKEEFLIMMFAKVVMNLHMVLVKHI